MQKKIPVVYMRGGTSKGLFFHEKNLPVDPIIRDRVILAAYGSPDPCGRQIDGMGGAASISSKVAIISPSESPNFDVNYLFGQVSIDRPIVDWSGSCGNILTAVGPFAVDEGLVKAIEPFTRVRIHQQNTRKLIISEFPVKNGNFEESGECMIDGVPFSGSPITLRFVDPGGSLTGKLFPTGNTKDTIYINGLGGIEVTVIDAGNPVVFVNAHSIRLKGIEIDEIDTDQKIISILETIRCKAAVKIGLAENEKEASLKSQSVPKVAFVAPPTSYRTVSEKTIKSSEIDLVARIMSMGNLHRSFAITGAIATAGAALAPGTVVNEILPKIRRNRETLNIGHPSGIINLKASIKFDNGRIIFEEAIVERTARRLMEGFVFVPECNFC